MAVLWKKQTHNTLYEVRTAGNSRRLYTNGIFHSQYNSRNLFTGSVWDMLALPGLFLFGQKQLRILVLGVGGGAAIHQLNYILNPCNIVGIEWDKMHIEIGQRFFDLKQDNIQLIYDNAQTWLDNNANIADKQRFDIIIDDIFSEQDGEPIRAIEADKQWFERLLAVLSDKGLIVQNHATPKSFRHCAYFKHEQIAAQFKSAFRIHNYNLHNIIGVFCKQDHDKNQLSLALADLKNLPVTINRRKLDYFIRKISVKPIY